MITVLFACVHNAGRSQIAAALFNKYADPAKGTRDLGRHTAGCSRASGSHRGDAFEGIDLSSQGPQRLTPELAALPTG